MDGRRSQRFDNNRRSQHKKPPRGSWQPTVPAWEKEFCKVVGSLDWETLLHMKKFMHLDKKVLEWNDSAGKEAFSNAKTRFWAEKNGLPCDLALPDPDLYIDRIDWDAEINPALLSDLDPMITDTEEDQEHDHVIIFGDALLPNQALPPTGWGDEDEKFNAAAARPTANYDGPITPTGWGDDDENVGVAAASTANYGDPWGDSFNSWAAAAWQGYPSGAWQGYSGAAPQFGNGTAWGGGWNNDWGWNYPSYCSNTGGPGMRDGRGGAEQGHWNNNNVPVTNTGGGYESSYRPSRAQANERRCHTSRHAEGRHRPPYSGRRSALGRRSTSRECTRITIERTGDQE